MALLRRRLLACLYLLALVVAFPASLPMAAGDDCYKTAMLVPHWCSGEFIQALFANNMRGISRRCCIMLACVRERACADVLRNFCVPPEAHDCPSRPRPLP